MAIHLFHIPVVDFVAGVSLTLLAAAVGNNTFCKQLYSSRTLHDTFCCRLAV